MTTVVTGTRLCAWRNDTGARCAVNAKTRRGNRGPRPRFCESHTIARKRAISHNPSVPRSSRPECCQAGVCRQHEQQRDYDYDFNEWWHVSQTERAKREEVFLLELFDNAITVTARRNPPGWRSHRGPNEGRTCDQVSNADPKGSAWYADHENWYRE